MNTAQKIIDRRKPPDATVSHYENMQAQAELAAARATIAELAAALRLCIAADDSTHEAKMQARRQARALLALLDAEEKS